MSETHISAISVHKYHIVFLIIFPIYYLLQLY